MEVGQEKSKRESNKLDKEKRLLEAAYKLFITKGIENTTVSHIVREAGIAKGTFYLYFQDKKAIEEKLIVNETVTIMKMAIRASNESMETLLEEQFLVAVDYIIDYLEENPRVLGFIKKNLSYAIYALNNEKRKESKFTNMYEQIYEQYKKNVSQTITEQTEIAINLCIEFLGASIYSSLVLKMPKPIKELRPHLHRVVRAIFKEYSI